MAKATQVKKASEGITAREWIKSMHAESGRKKLSETFSKICTETGISYRTIQCHVEYGAPIGVKTARKLQEWSKGNISAAKTLGV